jgi:hypothetical protein
MKRPYSLPRMQISVDGMRVVEAESFAAGDVEAARAEGASGLWGRKHVSPRAQPAQDAIVVGLPVVGICLVFPVERLIDGPGVLPEGRSADAYASLLVSACTVLGSGPADLNSWGDAEETIETYEDLGFDVVERVQGWELEL